MREADGERTAEDPRPVVVAPDSIAAGTDPLGIAAGTAPPGTYALVYSTAEPISAEIGALGQGMFEAGAYAYVGSAFGSNGLGRVDRHRRVAAGEHDVRHWHVDYFGDHPSVSLETVIAAPNADIECRLATSLRDSLASTTRSTVPVDGFGASDCTCRSHLLAAADAETLESTVVRAIAQLVR